MADSGGITIVGLGPGSPGALPLGSLEALQGSGRKMVRTEIHPVVPWLRAQGIHLEALDWAYRQGNSFAEVYRMIADHVLQAAARGETVIYAVPGHPAVAEASVPLITQGARELGIGLTSGPGSSALDAVLAATGLDPIHGLEILSAEELDQLRPTGQRAVLLLQLYDRQVASAAKLALLDNYPADFPVTVVRSAGIPGEERRVTVPLHELDHLEWIDHLTSACLPPLAPAAAPRHSLAPLVTVVTRLRGQGGCPWDREQTHRSLRPYVIEEAFEVADALDSEEMHNLREELGDLLLQIALHSVIAEEEGEFDIDGVVRSITEKMIRRHPHVFGGESVSSSREVLLKWETLKAAERNGAGPASLLEQVPVGLPALQRAYKLGRLASQVGFDWGRAEDAWAKLEEELAEFKAALRSGEGNREKVAEELGDLLFSVTNIARFLDVEPEAALGSAIRKFMDRFGFIEREARRLERNLRDMTLQEMDRLWDQAKEHPRKGKAHE